MKRSVAIAVFLLAGIGVLRADTHYVSPNGSNTFPYTSWATAATNIQAAIDAVSSGCEVFVTNGTYMLSSQIVITNGVAVYGLDKNGTIVDGNNITRCIRIDHTNALVANFTFRNGEMTSGSGGAVYIESGGVLSNCVVRDSYAGADGGGVFVLTNGMVVDCWIEGNSCSNDGAGIAIEMSGLVRNCDVVSNSCYDDAGGIQVTMNGLVSGCRVIGNTAVGWNGSKAGGVRLDHGGICEDTLIRGNRSREGGGAYTAFESAVPKIFRRCTITKNIATDTGGGCLIDIDGIFENCLIYENIASVDGGGVGNLTEGPYGGVIRNCTIYGNSAGSVGGGIGPGQYSVVNCIIVSNTAVADYDDCAALMTNCCVTQTNVQGANNMVAVPLFLDAANGDFRQKLGCPTIDAGLNLPDVTADFSGMPRPYDGDNDGTNAWDIGAYEHMYSTNYPSIRFRNAPYHVDEDDGTVRITLSFEGLSTGIVSVAYNTSNLNARAGWDYEETSGVVTWNPYESGDKSFTVPITDEAFQETAEVFRVVLSSPEGCAIVPPSVVDVTICSSDFTPRLEIWTGSVVNGWCWAPPTYMMGQWLSTRGNLDNIQVDDNDAVSSAVCLASKLLIGDIPANRGWFSAYFDNDFPGGIVISTVTVRVQHQGAPDRSGSLVVHASADRNATDWWTGATSASQTNSGPVAWNSTEQTYAYDLTALLDTAEKINNCEICVCISTVPTADRVYFDYMDLVVLYAPQALPVLSNAGGASGVGTDSARLNGALLAGGPAPEAWICWGDANGGRTSTGTWQNVESVGTVGHGLFWIEIDSLDPATTYFYACYASNSLGGAWSDTVAQFDTLSASGSTTAMGTPIWWLDSHGLTNGYDLEDFRDSDGDRLLTWQEYWAGTDPTNRRSCFLISGFGFSGGLPLLEWSTVSNKGYWVQLCTNLFEGTWTNITETPVYEQDEPYEGVESVVDSNAPTNCPLYYRILLE